jgi:hypothetical protein
MPSLPTHGRRAPPAGPSARPLPPSVAVKLERSMRRKLAGRDPASEAVRANSDLDAMVAQVRRGLVSLTGPSTRGVTAACLGPV